MKISEAHPPAHAKYLVRREGTVFTATPLYGLHEPAWVVRIMGEAYEAHPERMLPDDEWWPAAEFMKALDDGAGELLRVAEELLQWRAKLHLICAPYRDQMEGALFALTDLSTIVHHIQQGSAQEPSDVGN
jgi:hypothetical protein